VAETRSSFSSEDDERGWILHSVGKESNRGPSHQRYMIRVLILFPGREPDPICCELSHTYISNRQQEPQPERCQPYEALSYIWEDQSQTLDILVSGKHLEVTLNLESALRHLRQTNKPRFLWVDAVCINQKNIEERNAQVLRMNLIYEQARQVVV
jgi:hypothetical protein